MPGLRAVTGGRHRAVLTARPTLRQQARRWLARRRGQVRVAAYRAGRLLPSGRWPRLRTHLDVTRSDLDDLRDAAYLTVVLLLAALGVGRIVDLFTS